MTFRMQSTKHQGLNCSWSREQFASTFPKAEYQVPKTKLKLVKREVFFKIFESRVPSTKDQTEAGQESSLI
jgi:hypothetical protein